jgi:hypothetical protein
MMLNFGRPSLSGDRDRVPHQEAAAYLGRILDSKHQTVKLETKEAKV